MSAPDDTPPSATGSLPSSAVLAALTRAGVGFVALTPDGEIRGLNDAVADLTGREREALLGTAFTDALSTVPSALESVLDGEPASGDSLDLMVPLETATDAVVTCDAQITAVPAEDAIVAILTPSAASETGTPQLDPRHDEETAAKAFVALADSLSDGIIVLDATSQIQYANPAVEAILGYPPDELVGGSKLSIIPEHLREDHLNGLNQYLETGERHIDWRYVELPGRHRDGHEVPLGISLNDFVFEGSRYFVGLFRDVSQRKEAERALRERERQLEETVEELEESNERLEQFAYAASHDLQEPLRMVSSYLQLIERRYADDLDADGEEFIEFAVDGADRMREMIEGLLQYSRVETKGADFEPVDLDEVLADVRDDLQVRIDETDADVTAEALPVVVGDGGQLRQVFQNLLDNAIEYSGDESPVVRISAERNGVLASEASEGASDERIESDGDRWVIAVEDEGIGIEADDPDRVFGVFQRLHANDEHEGMGIGLALCERIVERHGGDIRVDSVPGEGTTFTFTLPAADARAG